MINLGSTMGAIEFILEHTESKLSHKKLLKLLYLADRESLFTFGWPITCDKPEALEKGPVLECVYALLKNADAENRDVFLKFFNVSDNRISLKKNFTFDWLSDNNLDVLRDICEKYGHLTGQELSEFTHTLPEWEGEQPMSWNTVLKKSHQESMAAVYDDLNTMLDNAPSRDEILEYV